MRKFCIACSAFVPAGFMDSGWAHYTVYVEAESLTMPRAVTILSDAVRDTEITKLDRITSYVVDVIPRGALVVNINGSFNRLEGLN